MTRAFPLLSLLLLAAIPHAALAQRFPDFAAQLQRIFNAQDFDASGVRNFRWLPDGNSYSITTTAPNQAAAVLVCNIASGRCAEKLKLNLEIESYEWSGDGKKLLVFTNSRRNWASDTAKYARKGDYWLVDAASGETRKIGNATQPSTLMFAKFSPDSRHVAYVQESDLYVEDIATKRVRQLTRDGSRTLLNGRTDWVYEEELSLADGFRWSPDSSRIAFLQFDISQEGMFSLINNTDTLYPQITQYPYPKAGTRNAQVRLGVVEVGTGKLRWTDTQGDAEQSYLARFQWKGAAQLCVLKLNRLQNAAELQLVDAATGKSRVIFQDSSDTWIDIFGDPLWLRDGQSVLWITERDGWRRVLKVNSTNGSATLVTRFDADVADVVGLDASGTFLYFTASPQNPIERHLYRARLDGSASPEQFSPGKQAGVHEYELSPDGKWAVHRYSRFQTPPTTEMISLPSHAATHVLADNRALVSKVAPYLEPPLEYFRVESEPGVPLDAWMMKPKDFNPAKKYPMILYVYGEPWSQTVLDQWLEGRGQRSMMFHRALTQLGFIVVSVDPRGTPSLRGTRWRRQIYGSIGPLSAKDYAGAVKRLAQERPYIDGSRVGVWGRSGGGTSTLNLMFRYPDTFHAGVSVAPVPDQRLYDTIYQERYMRLPAGNPQGYAESAIHHAQGLRGRLLLIHGSGDDNVHLQGSELLVNKLTELGKTFEMLVYPNRSHVLTEGKGTAYHQFLSTGRFFYEHLKPE